MYYIFSCEDPNEVYSLGKQTLQYYLDNNLYGYMIDTSLEGLAEQMGVPADTLAKTVEAFNAHTKAGDVDEFGRTSWLERTESTSFARQFVRLDPPLLLFSWSYAETYH